MAGTLLITGITLFLVGTLVLARTASDRGRNALVLIMPFTGLNYIRDHWAELHLAMLARVVGASLVVAALAVVVAKRPQLLEDPLQLLEVNRVEPLVGSKVDDVNSFALSERAAILGLRSDDNPDLTGRILGRRFAYDRVELINGMLSMQQGEGFIPEIEVRLLLGLDGRTLTGRENVFVRPEDDDAPELQISWLEPGSSLPQTKVFTSGYRMELQLAPLVPGQLKGFMQLILPGAENSYLSGQFVAFTNNLRYRNDRVDLTHDHPDTLEYLARQYIETQFPGEAISRIEYTGTKMHLSRGAGRTLATIHFRHGRVEQKRLEFERADIGWALRPGGITTTLLREGGEPAAPDALARTGGAVPSGEPPLALSFEELGTLAGQSVVVRQANGESRTVRILGVRRGALQVESQVGSGLVQFSLQPAEIAGLRLASGRPVQLPGTKAAARPEAAGTPDEAAAPAPAGTPSAARPPGSAPAPNAAEAQQTDFGRLDGREVEILGTDGRKRVGRLSVGERELRLSVRMGGGSLEYFYQPADIESIRPVNP